MDPSHLPKANYFMGRDLTSGLIAFLLGVIASGWQTTVCQAQPSLSVYAHNGLVGEMTQEKKRREDRSEVREVAFNFLQQHWGLVLETQGATLFIQQVTPGGRAQEAGLHAGDKLISVDHQVFTRQELLESYLQGNFDRAIPFEIRRNNQQLVVPVTIPLPPPSGAWAGITFTDGDTREDVATELGAVVKEVIAQSPANSAGIQVGDRITECEAQPIASSMEFEKLIERYPPGTELILRVDRNGDPRTVRLQLGNSESQSLVTSTSPKPQPIAKGTIPEQTAGNKEAVSTAKDLIHQQPGLQTALQKLSREVARLRLELHNPSRPSVPAH